MDNGIKNYHLEGKFQIRLYDLAVQLVLIFHTSINKQIHMVCYIGNIGLYSIYVHGIHHNWETT